MLIFTPRQNEGYCNHNVCLSSVDILVNTITWPILIRSWWNFTGLILDGKWRSLLNFVMMTSSVTSQWRHFRYFAPWACEHDNLTIFHPISTKLGMIDVIWVLTNPIKWRHDDVITGVTTHWFPAKIAHSWLVRVITWSFLNQSSPNLIWMI